MGKARSPYMTVQRKALSLAQSIPVPDGEDEAVPYPQRTATPEEKLSSALEHLADTLRAHLLAVRQAEHILQDARAAVARCDSRVT